MLVRRIKKLHDIDPRSWEHPADRAALSGVRQLKGLDELVKILMSLTSERSIKLLALASSVKVGPNQYPRLDNILNNVVDVFDWDYKPPIYITQSPVLNAGVLGVKEPFIMLNSYLVRSFDEEELTAIIAHEMGHIMSGHSLYKTMIWMLTNVSFRFIPLGELLVYAIAAALSEWNRKSELTADRAELLALQVETPCYNVLMKMAGAEDLSQVNLNEFFAQAQEYENQKTLVDSIHKVLNQMWATHPYPVVRLQELRSWALSGQYEAIMGGNYLRRGKVEDDLGEDVKRGYESYKAEFRGSEDPLMKFVGDVGEGLEKAAGDIEDRIRRLFDRD